MTTRLRTGTMFVALLCTSSCNRPSSQQSSANSDSIAAASASATPSVSMGDVAIPSDNEEQSKAGIEVRFLNAVTTLPSVVLLLSNGAPEIHTVTGTVTPYRPFAAGDIQVAVIKDTSRESASTSTDTDTTLPSLPKATQEMGRPVHAIDTLAVRREMLRGGGRYTIIAMPSDDGEGVTLRVVADSILPDTTVAQVRLIHASALSGEFDLLLVGTHTAVFEGVSFANATPFQRLAPSASQQLALRQVTRPAHPTTIPSIQQLDAGKAYTIVITGLRDHWETVTVRDDISRALASRVRTSPRDSTPAGAKPQQP
jgi:hypothetical protein